MLAGHPTEGPPFNLAPQRWTLNEAGSVIKAGACVDELRVRRAPDWSWRVESAAELLVEVDCTEAEKRATLATATHFQRLEGHGAGGAGDDSEDDPRDGASPC